MSPWRIYRSLGVVLMLAASSAGAASEDGEEDALADPVGLAASAEIADPPKPHPSLRPRRASRQPVGAPGSSQESRGAGLPIHISTHRTAVPPFLAAQQAIHRGDSGVARGIYEKLLAANAQHTDALAALALFHLRLGETSTAQPLIDKTLALAPGDPFAESLLAAIQGEADPVRTESRLRTLLAEHPNAGPLHFALGNLNARQGRWREAQEAYFRANVTDRHHPDYLFNLAVSLEHLQQARAAGQYYQAALTAASQRPAAFNQAVAQARIQYLEAIAP